MTQNILACRDLLPGWELIHLDTQKPGGLAGKGALNLLNLWFTLRNWLLLLRILLLKKPQLVHMPLAQNPLGFARDAAFLLSAKTLGFRVLLHAYGGDFQAFTRTQPQSMRAAIRHILCRADRVAVVSENLASQFDGIFPPSRIIPIPNCISVTGRPASRPQNHSQTVLFLGKISVAKGAVDFVRAAALLLSRGSREQLRFRMVGDFLEIERNVTFLKHPNGAREQIQRLLELPWCEQAISVIGPVENDAKWAEYASADIFVAPSYSEGTPLTVLEAMAAGLPIVASRVGGLPEILGPRQLTFLVAPGDVTALADRIHQLASDSNLRAELGEENREIVESNFGLPALARHLQLAYQAIAGDRC